MREFHSFIIGVIASLAFILWPVHGGYAQTRQAPLERQRLIDIFSQPPSGDREKVAAFIEKLKSGLDNGADINATDQYGNNPLLTATYWAAWSSPDNGYNDIVAFLLSRGADVNVSSNGTTVFTHVATGMVNVKLVELLCAAGADPRAKQLSGISPLEMSRSNSFPQIARAMEQCVPKK